MMDFAKPFESECRSHHESGCSTDFMMFFNLGKQLLFCAHCRPLLSKIKKTKSNFQSLVVYLLDEWLAQCIYKHDESL